MRLLADENFPGATVAALASAGHDIGWEPSQRLAALIGSRQDWIGNFSVVEPGRIRMRPLK